MLQTKIWQMTLFQNLILFENHHGNLQEMLEMAFFLKYVDLYLTSEWRWFYVGHSVYIPSPNRCLQILYSCLIPVWIQMLDTCCNKPWPIL
jgi:hypothetical protein